jgi:hypothetical protein
MFEHIRELDRLYLESHKARDQWLDDGSEVSLKRADAAHDRYIAKVVEGERRFKLAPIQVKAGQSA